MVEASPRRVFANAHTYHINSISVNSDNETYLSADDLRINLWHLEITDRSFSILKYASASSISASFDSLKPMIMSLIVDPFNSRKVFTSWHKVVNYWPMTYLPDEQRLLIHETLIWISNYVMPDWSTSVWAKCWLTPGSAACFCLKRFSLKMKMTGLTRRGRWRERDKGQHLGECWGQNDAVT